MTAAVADPTDITASQCAGEVTLTEPLEDLALSEAILLFGRGEFTAARENAEAAEARARALASTRVKAAAAEKQMRSSAASLMDSLDDESDGDDADWKLSLDMLAMAYEETNHTEQAESLYLRMLAWREGAEQYGQGHFNTSLHLFEKSPEYVNVDEAVWFLNGLKPGDGHAISDVIVLLALGEQVAAKAAMATFTLAMNPKLRPKLTECGGLELLTKAVSYHTASAELQAAGCGALRLLFQGHKLAGKCRREFIIGLNGAEVLANSLRSHPHDAEVQREACGALYAAAAQHPEGARHILDCGGMRLCLEAIVGCPGDGAVGEAACKAIAEMQNASQASPGATEAQKEDLEAVWEGKLRSERETCLTKCGEELWQSIECCEQPAVEALLSAVAILLSDPSVRHRATNPLISLVVTAMQRFPGLWKVQTPACHIFWLLTAGHLARDEAVYQVARTGGISQLCLAMQSAPCSIELQRNAVGALRNVTFGNDAHKTLGVRAGGIALAVKAMQRFPRDAILQDHAIGALTSLCDTIGRANRCASFGGIEAIITSLKNHSNDANISQLGCVILCMFCDDPKLRQHLLCSGALQVAKNLSKASVSEAQRWGCELLRDLSEPQV
jgi:hypothetical protein